MKKTVCILAIIALTSFGSEYENLYNEIQVTSKTFKDSPSESMFFEAKAVAEKMIQLDELDGRGYVYLSRLYEYAAGTIMDEVEAREAAFSIIDQYQKIPGRKFDLSEVHSLLGEMIVDAKQTEKLNRDTQRMLDSTKVSPAIASSRLLLSQYYEKARSGGSFDGSLLDEALAILNDELRKDRTDYKVYLELFKVHMTRQDYASAYAIWQLAYHFGDRDDPALWNVTKDLYLKGKNYEINQDISDETPGSQPMIYFLWLNRESIAQTLPPEIKFKLDELMLNAKKKKAEYLEK